jgi:hypothetical protein
MHVYCSYLLADFIDEHGEILPIWITSILFYVGELVSFCAKDRMEVLGLIPPFGILDYRSLS